MSKRDEALIEALGVSHARFADLLGRSRQAVSRGVGKEGDYFTSSDLASVLLSLRSVEDPLYGLFETTICERYPEFSAAILSALSSAKRTLAPFGAAGDYYFVYGDFATFRTTYPKCLSQFEALLIPGSVAHVTILVNEKDVRPLQFFLTRLAREEDVRAGLLRCDTVDLRLFPTMVVFTDESSNVGLYLASEGGFEAAPEGEIARIKGALLALRDACDLCAPEPAN